MQRWLDEDTFSQSDRTCMATVDGGHIIAAGSLSSWPTTQTKNGDSISDNVTSKNN